MYKRAKDKVIIICHNHGEFKQEAHSHSIGRGCPMCKLKSNGENLIRKWLIDNKIEFEQQKRFDTCIGTRNRLPFDFYLPKYNLLIEYDGKQHFSNKSWSGEEGLRLIRDNDAIKTKWALDNNIKLLRISYKDKKSATSIIAAALLTIQR
jgi:very-short-patch-repair endonuclease